MITPFKIRYGAAYFFICFLFACGRGETSQVAHDLNKPVRSKAAWNWFRNEMPSDDELFLKFFAQGVKNTNLKFLDTGDEVSLAMQDLVRDLDVQIRKDDLNAFEHVPRPQVMVHVDDTANAAVVPVPVCFSGPEFFTSRASGPDVGEVYLSWEGVLALFGNEGCKHVELQPSEYRVFAKWLNENLVTKCRVEARGEALLFEEGCLLDKKMKPARFSSLVVFVTGHAVVMNLGLIKQFDLPQLTSILAHELGHFYRSHATAALEGKDYNFFYQIAEGTANAPRRPIAQEELRALGEQVRTIRLPNRLYRRIDQQKIISEFFRPVSMIIKAVDSLQVCGAFRCNQICKEAAEWLDQPQTKQDLDDFPFRRLSKLEEITYRTYEEKALACINTLKVAATTARDGSAIGTEQFKDTLSQDHELYVKVFQKSVPSDTVIRSLALAKQSLDDYITALLSPLREAKEQRLGYYTVEQEADELSLEWTSDLGFRSQHAVETELVYAALREQRELSKGIGSLPFYVAQSRCSELLKNNWKDETGTYQFIPIADYADPHHSSCYRAYNLSREAAGHAFSDDLVREGEALRRLSVTPERYKRVQAVTHDVLLKLGQKTELKVTPGSKRRSSLPFFSCPFTALSD